MKVNKSCLLVTTILAFTLPLTSIATIKNSLTEIDNTVGITTRQLAKINISNTKNADLLGLSPNLSLEQVKKQGIKLTPYFKKDDISSDYEIYPFYGMHSFIAEQLPKPLPNTALVVLCFNNQEQLKLIQLESVSLKDDQQLSLVNRAITTVVNQLENSFGKSEISHQKGATINSKFLPIYKMKTDDVWVSVTPIIKRYHDKDVQTAYIIKYYVQADKKDK